MVPHIAARKTHHRLREFSLDTPKRLLQQNLPLAAVSKSQHRERPYRAGRSPHWIKVKNRKHASLTREF
jgi:hypothetical protein